MDRATETLKRRVSQLENELHTATAKNEEMERTMTALRAEAHDVVGQWEKEAYDVGRKLNASEARVAELERSLNAQHRLVEDLQNESGASKQVIAEYSASIKELQGALALVTKERDENSGRAAAAEEASAAFAARVEKYETLTNKMQAELTAAVDEKQRDAQHAEALQKALDEMTEEARFVRREKEELSNHAEKLLLRTHDLKQQNAALLGDGDALSQQVDALHQEIEMLRPRAAAADELEQTVKAACEREQQLSSTLDELKTEVDTLNRISQEQLTTITTLEADIQEFRDGEENYKRAAKELQAALEAVSEQNEELEKELSVVRENYSSVLIELSEVKSASEVAVEKLERQVSNITNHHNQTSAEWLQENERTASLMQQLSADIQEAQLRDLVRMEIIERGEMTENEEREHAQWLQILLRSVSVQCASQTSRALALASQNADLESTLAQTTTTVADLNAKLSAVERSEGELRKANGILENKFRQLDAELQSSQTTSQALAEDNAVLKNQVESMRAELGELDEIVNANLTEMRESNETLVAKNALLTEELESVKEAADTASRRADALAQQMSAMESEHAAQSTALHLAEDDLRKHKELAKRHEGSVATAHEELRYAQERVDELERENRRITADASILRDTVSTLETKMKFIVADKRQELDAIRVKLNTYVEKAESNELRAASSDERRKEAEAAATTAKDSHLRMRAALDELKERCSRDTESIKQLLLERDDSIKERDLIVEKYNRLHDAFHSVRKEISGKAADELHRLLGLCEKQEDELQQLRKQNTILKKSVSMFVSTPPPKAEAVFMEHLNLAEGPLRHPKKRAAMANQVE